MNPHMPVLMHVLYSSPMCSLNLSTRFPQTRNVNQVKVNLRSQKSTGNYAGHAAKYFAQKN